MYFLREVLEDDRSPERGRPGRIQAPRHVGEGWVGLCGQELHPLGDVMPESCVGLAGWSRSTGMSPGPAGNPR